MTMKKDKKLMVDENLEAAVNKFDMDGVLYRLTQIAVKKRDEGEGNKPEEEYWQKVLVILQHTESQVEGL